MFSTPHIPLFADEDFKHIYKRWMSYWFLKYKRHLSEHIFIQFIVTGGGRYNLYL